METYVLRCKSCGGTLEKSEEEGVLICPFCGAKEILEESDTVKIAKIEKEMELGRQKILADQMREEKQSAALLKFRKSKTYKAAILLLILSLFGCLLAAANSAHGCVVVSLIQVALSILAFLFGFGVIKTKRKNIPLILVLCSVILIFVYLEALSVDSEKPVRQKEVPAWESLELSSVIPKPDGELIYVYTDTSERLSCEVDPCATVQYKAYTEACKEAGFTVDANFPYENSFSAYNEEGYRLQLYHYSQDYLSIQVDAPIEMSEFIWPTHGLAKQIPAPQSGYGKIESDTSTYFNAFVGKTSKSDYSAYVSAVIEAGFDEDYYRYGDSFSAENEDGVRISIDYEGNQTMHIRMSDYND